MEIIRFRLIKVNCVTEWNPERFLRWAESIEETVRRFISGLMDSKSHPEQACQGVLGYGNILKL